MEKYHYDPEEYPNLKRLAGEMIPCLETEAGWQDREIQETFPGRDQSFLAVGITLGKGIDELQEKYLQNGFLTESYMIEVLSSELLLKSYQAYTKWVADHRELHVARLYFLGSVAGESGSSEKKLNDRLQLENLPVLLWELQMPVTCNEAYCMIPKKSVVFYAELTKDLKVRLLSIPTLETNIGGKRSPLMVAVGQTTASLYKCFSGELRRISYPEM